MNVENPMNIAYDVLIDTSDEECPVPTIKTKEALDEMASGAVLKLIASQEGSIRNIRTLVKNNDCELLHESRTTEEFLFFIRKR